MTVVTRRQHATLAVLASAAIFGTTGTVFVNAPASADPFSVGAVRLLVGAATLAAIATATSTTAQNTTHTATHTAAVPAPRIAAIAIGAVGVAVFQLCYFLAVDRTGVAVGTVATIGSGPMIGGILAAISDRRAPARRWLIGTALGVGGIALLGLVGEGAADGASVDAAGIALAFLAGLGWAVFATIGKRQIDNGRDSTTAMAAMFGGGAILLAPLLLWHDPNWVASGSGALVALYLGVVTVGVAYTLYGYALRRLATPSVLTLTLLEPITAAVLGAVVVHERIGSTGWAGIALVLAGLTLVTTITV